MPVHYVNTPDGKRIEVTAPEGASQAEIVAYAQKMYAQEQKKTLKPVEKPVNPTEGMTSGDKFVSGVGSAMVNTGMGLKQAGLWAGNKAGIVDDSTLANYQSEVDAERKLQAPLLDTGWGTAGNIGGNIALGAAGGSALAPLKAAQGAGWLARGGVAAANGGIGGAALASTQPVGSGETRLGNTVEGAKWGMAGGAAGHTIGTGIGRLAKGAADKYGQDVIDLYNAAKSAGINILPHQLSDSRVFKTVASVLAQLPFTGGVAANKAQIDDYTRMVSKLIKQDTDAISPEVQKSAKLLNKQMYKTALDGVDIPNGDDLVASIRAKSLDDALYDDKQRAMFEAIAKRLESNLKDGSMSGHIYQEMRDLFRGSNNDTSRVSRELIEAWADKNMPKQAREAWNAANRLYGNRQVVKKAMQGADTPRAPTSTEYKVNPATFRNAINPKYPASPEVELASRIGQKIKDPIPDSGTPGRAVALLGLGGAATGTAGLSLAALSPLAKLIAVGATAGRVANSKGLANYMAYGTPKVVQGVARQIEQKAPGLLGTAAVGGAMASAPLMAPDQFDAKLRNDIASGRVTKAQAAGQLDAYLQTLSKRQGIDSVREIYKQYPNWSSLMAN